MSIVSLREAQVLREGRRLVFTNGVFDVLHVGHVRCLEEARRFGEMLIVGVNSDESARGLGKGPGRPVNTAADRAEVVAALRAVDAVVIFDEPDPRALIAALRPEVHVKGGDYAPDDLTEAELVRSYGGEIRIVPLIPGVSTTETLRRLEAE